MANPDYHYETTAVEIFEQMGGKVDAVVLGCGTCGTFTGIARYMKEHVPGVRAVAVETQGSVSGWRRAWAAQGGRDRGEFYSQDV